MRRFDAAFGLMAGGVLGLVVGGSLGVFWLVILGVVLIMLGLYVALRP